MAIDKETGEIKNDVAAREVAERFMFGDLQKLIIGELKQTAVAWSMLPEKEQAKVIKRVAERAEKIARECVDIIAGKARPCVRGDIDSVLFKDGVRVTLTLSKSAGDRHAIADATGGTVLLVLPDYETVLTGDGPVAAKDQPELY